jgi:hypothetical protein
MRTISLVFATVMLVTTALLTPRQAQALGSGWGGGSDDRIPLGERTTGSAARDTTPLSIQRRSMCLAIIFPLQ